MPLTPDERRNDIAALKALSEHKWTAVIRHHEQEIKKSKAKEE